MLLSIQFCRTAFFNGICTFHFLITIIMALKFQSLASAGLSAEALSKVKATCLSVKSTFTKKVWFDGQVIKLITLDVVCKESEMAEFLKNHTNPTDKEIVENVHLYPVLTTQLQKPDGTFVDYEPLWLKTLLSTVEDAEGNDLMPDGELNKLARQLYEAAISDEQCLKQLLEACKDKTIKVVRKKPYKYDFYGRIKTGKLLEFTF